MGALLELRRLNVVQRKLIPPVPDACHGRELRLRDEDQELGPPSTAVCTAYAAAERSIVAAVEDLLLKIIRRRFDRWNHRDRRRLGDGSATETAAGLRLRRHVDDGVVALRTPDQPIRNPMFAILENLVIVMIAQGDVPVFLVAAALLGVPFYRTAPCEKGTDERASGIAEPISIRVGESTPAGTTGRPWCTARVIRLVPLTAGTDRS